MLPGERPIMILSQSYFELLCRLETFNVLEGKCTPADQLLKLQEEAGEVAAAWCGFRGTNARKGFTHTLDDVIMELADVAIVALVAIRMLGHDPDLALYLQAQKTEKRLDEYEAQRTEEAAHAER